MKVPESWLREHCDPDLSVEELGDLIALRTTEVERIARPGPLLGGRVRGRHGGLGRAPPRRRSAERLRGRDRRGDQDDRLRGAERRGWAAGGGRASGRGDARGEKLGRAKLRGVVSDGMILSESELELGDDADGIMVLEQMPRPPRLRLRGAGSRQDSPGTPLAEILPIAESVLELEVNSNRVDCLGVYGVAREVHAITGAPLSDPPWRDDAEATGDDVASDLASVEVEVPELCPRFTARVFTEVTIGPSPLWLRARLTAAGQRPINNLVDITNYVMLLTAQPLHAFDLDRVPGGELIVRTARDGETMTTLDGVERSFDSESVLVCDRDGPSGIAGIMGGQASEVSASTRSVLLEVACWDGVNILRTSRRLGLRSEASNRFEKQLHPELTIRAQRVASKLIVELCGARMVPGTIDEAGDVPPARRVRLRASRTEALLGMPVEREECATYLERLGFGVAATARIWWPRSRSIATTTSAARSDLVEEVGRIHGYDEHLPATLPQARRPGRRLTREQVLRRRAEDVLRDLGFDAVVSLSLVDPDLPRRMRFAPDDPRHKPIRVSNPLSIEHSELRTTLLGSLLDAARHNLARGAERVALCESGRAYLASGSSEAGGVVGGEFVGRREPPAFEPQCIAALAVGPLVARAGTTRRGPRTSSP